MIRILDKKKEEFICDNCHKEANYVIVLENVNGIKKVCLGCAAYIVASQYYKLDDKKHDLSRIKAQIIAKKPVSREFNKKKGDYWNHNMRRWPILKEIINRYYWHPFIGNIQRAAMNYEISENDMSKVKFFIENKDIFCSLEKTNFYLFCLRELSYISAPFFKGYIRSLFRQFERSRFLTEKQLKVVDRTIDQYKNYIAKRYLKQ